MKGILFFGIAQDIVGNDKLSWQSILELSKTDRPNTVGELKEVLFKTYPRLGELSSLAIAVNQEYAEENLAIAESDEIAIIPPVSGG